MIDEVILKGEYVYDIILQKENDLCYMEQYDGYDERDLIALVMKQIEQLYNELGQILLRNNK